VSGHYDRRKTVSENLRLPANILSRFDLIFVLLDRPDDHMDRLLSKHVMALHAGRDGSGAKRMAEGGAAGGHPAFAAQDGYDMWRAQETSDSLTVRLREAAAKLVRARAAMIVSARRSDRA
jgi:DNA replicative helicase MCM subunit Mcm2 (Cdc46/Mcm family)